MRTLTPACSAAMSPSGGCHVDHVCVCECVCARANVCVSVNLCMYTYAHTHTCTCTDVHIHRYMHMCTSNTDTHTQTDRQTDTHTHTFPSSVQVFLGHNVQRGVCRPRLFASRVQARHQPHLPAQRAAPRRWGHRIRPRQCREFLRGAATHDDAGPRRRCAVRERAMRGADPAAARDNR